MHPLPSRTKVVIIECSHVLRDNLILNWSLRC
jgi:hypothetical protein